MRVGAVLLGLALAFPVFAEVSVGGDSRTIIGTTDKPTLDLEPITPPIDQETEQSIRKEAREQMASRLTGERLASAMKTVRAMSKDFSLSEPDPKLRRECFAAVEILRTPHKFYRASEVSAANEAAFFRLATGLEPFCTQAFNSELEILGLNYLKNQALESLALGSIGFHISKGESEIGGEFLSCWDGAQNVAVIVRFLVNVGGKADPEGIMMLNQEGRPSAAETDDEKRAFNSATSAIEQCGSRRLGIGGGAYSAEFRPGVGIFVRKSR